jgi:hypothetical protein
MAFMNGRAIVRFVLALIAVAVLVGIGVGIYQSGVQQGILDAGRVPAGGAVPYGDGYGYRPGFFGFGFLGILFPLFFIFLIFGLLRAAFGGGRGHRGWGGHGWGGHGYGPGGPGSDPSSWQAERDRRIAELHQRLHESGGPGSGPSGGGTTSGPSGGTTTGSSAGSAGATGGPDRPA